LPTPNYNLLNYSGLSIFTIGTFLIELWKQSSKTNFSQVWFGWALIGLGGFLVFMAKPTTAAGLTILVSLWAWLSDNFSLKGFFFSAAIAFGLLSVSGLILDGSIPEFVSRYINFFEALKISKTHSSLLALNISLIRTVYTVYFFFHALFLIFWGYILGYISEYANKKYYFYFIYFSIAFFTISIILYLYSLCDNSYIYGSLICFAPLGLIIYNQFNRSILMQRIEKSEIGRALLFFLLTFIFGLGSNNSIAITASIASFFSFLGLLVMAIRPEINAPLRLIGLCLSSLLVVCLTMISAWAHPYRQLSPIWLADVPTSVPIDGPKINMPAYQSQFFDSLYKITRQGGFKSSTPVIDLTGRLPGVIYAMGGTFPKSAWLMSGYEGSRSLAVHLFKRLSCHELASAWLILFNPPGPYQFHQEILQEAGLDFQDHYQLTGVAKFPVQVIGREIFINELLVLKPQDDWEKRAETCETLRRDAGGMDR
jgi:hypothetical protein